MRNGWVMIAMLMMILSMTAGAAYALVAVSQMGYHPEGIKTATVYTSAPSGTFTVYRNGVAVATGLNLTKARDGAGQIVECQGDQPCLIGDFSSITQPGSYMIRASVGSGTEDSPLFTISDNVYRDNAVVFNEFFNALKQTGSSYHADMNEGLSPQFNVMADGSFIMQAHQAGRSLIRLGNAYRRNPQLLDDTIIDTMIDYADYLATLQDVKVQHRTDGVGFRTDDWMDPYAAFTPGPTSQTEVTVYSGGNPLKTVPLRSLCAPTGTVNQTCVEQAAAIYKCQMGEICLEQRYIGSTATVVPGTDGMGVDNGWQYIWSCYYDVDLENGNYNDRINPCMMYDANELPETASDTDNAAIALLAYAEAIPPIHAKDPQKASELLARAIATHEYVKGTALNSNEAAYFGAASFILYDLTGDEQYLQDAYGMRSTADRQLHQDKVFGSEFYWQEFIAHKDDILAQGWDYAGANPEHVFYGQVIGDYWNGNDLKKVSKSAERVYQQFREWDPDFGGFQNSRAQLSESIFASKAIELSSQTPAYAREMSDAQIAWITGNNAIDYNTINSDEADIRSISFIFGIGQDPQQFHARLLQDTGYARATGGRVKGMQGSDFQLIDPATGDLEWSDGRSFILGEEFGAQGNRLNGETSTPQLDGSKTFKNGKRDIPGWINGALDIGSDDDVIYDYADNRNIFQYTESENDIVATAIEAFAYADARYNDVEPLPTPQITPGEVPPPEPVPTEGTVQVTTSPSLAEVAVDGIVKGDTSPVTNSITFNVTAGTHQLVVRKTGYVTNESNFTITAGELRQIGITLNAVQIVPNSTNTTNATNTTNPPTNQTTPPTNQTNSTSNSTLSVSSIPSGANVTLDGTLRGTTPLTITNVAAGSHTLTVSKAGYLPQAETFSTSGGLVSKAYVLIATPDGNAPQVLGTPTVTNTTSQTAMLETQQAVFTIQYDRVTHTDWYVNDVLIDSEDASRSVFNWYPTIVYTGDDTRPAVIKAVATGNVTTTFTMQVTDVINPFWSGVDGGPDVEGPASQLNVHTNNQVQVYSAVSATISDKSGQGTHQLTDEWSDASETAWRKDFLGMAPGNTQVISITVTPAGTNTTQTYTIDANLGHYNPQGVDGGRRGGGGGGFKNEDPFIEQIAQANDPPEFIYAVFSSDTVLLGDDVELSVDVRDDEKVVSVVAIITDENGNEVSIPLELTDGAAGYGTWTGIAEDYPVGKHTLSRLIITDDLDVVTTAEVGDRAFYVAGDEVLSGERLLLVYAILDKSSVDPGEPLTVRLDARDFLGIESINALLKSKDQEIPVKLELVGGDATYGTWEGTVELDTPDTTYALVSVTMSNGNETKEQRVYGQKVYVNYVEPTETLSDASEDKAKQSIRQIVRNPITPLIIGLVGMGIAMLIVSSMTFFKGDRE